jgi:phenylacetate-CoA ligase
MIRYPLIQRLWYRWKKYPAQEILDQLEKSQWWSPEEMRDFKTKKIQSLIAHCWENVPYYHDVMEERGLTPDDVRSLEDLAKLPVLTKEIIRREGDRLVAGNIPREQMSLATTGGTTGEPMRILTTAETVAWSTQCTTRAYAWAGVTPTTKRVKLFGGSLGQPDQRSAIRRWYDRTFSPDLFLPAFEMTRDNVRDYIRQIKDFGAKHLIGYASATFLLANFVDDLGESLSLDAVFPTAELLPDNWRARIKEVFGCKVLPYYGCGECNSLGYTCADDESIYHQCDEHAVMEVDLGDGRSALEGEGAFLITDLDNYAMPVIRYRNGDGGVLAGPGCSCGRSLSRILRLDGRVNDLLVTVGGNTISGVIATHTFRHVKGAKLYQFVQDQPGQVQVRIVRTDGYDPAVEEERIGRILRKHLGEQAQVTFEYPEDIERTPAGKARFVINRYLAGAGG